MNKVLNELIKIAEIHANRIKLALEKIGSFFPISPEIISKISSAYIAYLDLYTNRFAKLQDLVDEKVFTEILKALEGEVRVSKITFIDKLNKLEQLEAIKNAEEWKNMRQIRNHISHKYPDMPAVIAKYLNEIHNIVPKLLNYLERIISFTAEQL